MFAFRSGIRHWYSAGPNILKPERLGVLGIHTMNSGWILTFRIFAYEACSRIQRPRACIRSRSVFSSIPNPELDSCARHRSGGGGGGCGACTSAAHPALLSSSYQRGAVFSPRRASPVRLSLPCNTPLSSLYSASTYMTYSSKLRWRAYLHGSTPISGVRRRRLSATSRPGLPLPRTLAAGLLWHMPPVYDREGKQIISFEHCWRKSSVI
jgi:hypothetical protein